MDPSDLLAHYARHLTDTSGRSPAIRLRARGIAPLATLDPLSVWQVLREGDPVALQPLTSVRALALQQAGVPLRSVTRPDPMAGLPRPMAPGAAIPSVPLGAPASGEAAAMDPDVAAELAAHLTADEPDPSAYMLDLAQLPPLSASMQGAAITARTGLPLALGADDAEAVLRRLVTKDRELRDEKSIHGLTLGLWTLRYRDDATSAPWVDAPLALLPVAMEERLVGGRTRFAVRAAGPLDANEALWARVRTHWGVDLPPLPDLPDEDARQDALLQAWLGEVTQAIAQIDPQWSLHGGAAFAIITTQKQALRRDLLAADSGAIAAGLPVFRALHDPDTVQWPAAPVEPLDATFAPEDVPLVVGADGSQLEAVRHALDTEASIVIQGPPGTGKSQTITTLLAGAVSRGRRVLFVAEKRAALDVVASRLAQVGLARACLVLHGEGATRKALTDQLNAVVDAAQAGEGGDPFGLAQACKPRLQRLRTIRDHLTARDAAVHAPRFGLQQSFHELTGVWERATASGGQPTPLPGREARAVTRETLDGWRTTLAQLEALATQLDGTPQTHPLIATRLARVGPAEQQQAEAALDTLTRAIHQLDRALTAARQQLGEAETTGPEALLQQVTLLQARPLGADQLTDAQWLTWRDAAGPVHALAPVLAAEGRLQGREQTQITPAVRTYPDGVSMSGAGLLARDVALLTQQRRGAKKWVAWLSGPYRRTLARVVALQHPTSHASRDELLAQLADAVQEVAAAQTLAQTPPALVAAYGPLADAAARAAEPDAPARLAAWAPQWVANRHVPETTRLWETPSAVWQTLQRQLEAASRDLAQAEQTAAQTLGVPTLDLPEWPAADLLARVTLLRQAVATWNTALQWRQLRTPLAQTPTLAPLFADHAGPSVATLDASLAQTLLAEAAQEAPLLQDHGAVVTQRQGELAAIDAQLLEANQALVVAQWMQGVRDRLYQRVTKVREVLRPRKYAGVPGYFQHHLDEILDLTPLVLMSPLAVSQYLPRRRADGTPPFDLVVFDEASQVHVADALPSLLRAKQVVVVGDDKQMPPSRLFQGLDPTDHDALGTPGDVDADESLLTRLGRLGADLPQHLLQMHYRSRDERLIQFSNTRFYEGRLETFPTPQRALPAGAVPAAEAAQTPLRWVPVEQPGYAGEGRNPVEAAVVVDQILQHLATTPTQSLGVVTFGLGQQDEIRQHLEARRQQDPAARALLDAYAAAHPEEPLFVKNLENVQGDERDHIVLSITYGPTPDGRLRRQFGPLLTGRDGQRRLNVLVSRSRERMSVVSSVRGAALREGTTSSAALLIADFLEYVERGGLTVAADRAIPRPTTPRQGGVPDFDSRFEASVYQALTRAVPQWLAELGVSPLPDGPLVDAQVGVGRSRIDLALVDPRDPSRYLFGVECDGEFYHGAKTARDRDLLRQRRLRDHHGWHLERIWCTDWADRRDEVLQRLRGRVVQLLGPTVSPADRAVGGTVPALGPGAGGRRLG